MKEIRLNNGMIFVVDDIDYMFLLNMIPWFAGQRHKNKSFYAYRMTYTNNKRHSKFVHQYIIERMGLIVPKGMLIDHIDRDGLHNWRDNLRVTTYSVNAFNVEMYGNNTSGIKGIYQKGNRFCMYYRENKVSKYKYFDTFDEAANARLQWEIKENLI